VQRHPADRDLLLALALFERDAGRRERALVHARRLAALEPGSAEARRLVAELEAAGR
jgi:Flp pilus assembly protein TadD